MSDHATVRYQRRHDRGLTLTQLNAIDLLASGKSDRETAELVNVARTTITRWRLHDILFVAALNQRRAEVWSAGVDRLRSLIPQALDALGDILTNREHPDRVKAATAVLRLLPSEALTIGPTTPEEIVRQIVEERRQVARPPVDDALDEISRGLPPYDAHIEEVWQEMDQKATEGFADRQSQDEKAIIDAVVGDP